MACCAVKSAVLLRRIAKSFSESGMSVIATFVCIRRRMACSKQVNKILKELFVAFHDQLY